MWQTRSDCGMVWYLCVIAGSKRVKLCFFTILLQVIGKENKSGRSTQKAESKQIGLLLIEAA